MAKVKGSQILGVVKTLRTNPADFSKVLPQHLMHYMTERIVVSEWYPDEDHRDLVLIVGHWMEGRVKGNVWRWMGEFGAKKDRSGLYATMTTDPASRLMRSAAGWSLFRDTGTMLGEAVGSKSGRIELRDYPMIVPEMAELMAGYNIELLRAAGANRPECIVMSCNRPVGVTVWVASWS